MNQLFFVHTKREVIILDNNFAFPIAFGALLNSDPEMERYFFQLPEEVQQQLLKDDVHSDQDLRDRIEEYRLKQ